MAKIERGEWPFIIALVLFVGGCGVMVARNDASSGSGPDITGAQQLCQQAVEARLKAPATADFSSWRESTDSGSANGKTLFGTVDAENSFGAMLRLDFTCRMHSSGDTWVLETVSGLDG